MPKGNDLWEQPTGLPVQNANPTLNLSTEQTEEDIFSSNLFCVKLQMQ